MSLLWILCVQHCSMSSFHALILQSNSLVLAFHQPQTRNRPRSAYRLDFSYQRPLTFLRIPFNLPRTFKGIWKHGKVNDKDRRYHIIQAHGIFRIFLFSQNDHRPQACQQSPRPQSGPLIRQEPFPPACHGMILDFSITFAYHQATGNFSTSVPQSVQSYRLRHPHQIQLSKDSIFYGPSILETTDTSSTSRSKDKPRNERSFGKTCSQF